MRKLEHLGIRDSTVGLVIPTGYSFNLDAFSLYLTLATVFIAQATNTDTCCKPPACRHVAAAIDDLAYDFKAGHPTLV